MKAKLKIFTSYKDIFDSNKNNITFDEFCLKWCEPYNITKQVITKNVIKTDTDSICELLKNGFTIDWVDSVGISLVKTIDDPLYIDTEYNTSIKELYEKYIEFANKRIDYENQIIELSKNAIEKTNEKYFLENELRKVELYVNYKAVCKTEKNLYIKINELKSKIKKLK